MKYLYLAIIAIFIARPSWATKPCGPSICNNEKDCFKQAEWVAVGSIKNIQHDYVGPPLLKDFAQFDLFIERWEKGEDKTVKLVKFKVGWCENSQPLPISIKSKYRFFGNNSPKLPFNKKQPSASPQYLMFVPIN